MKHTIFALVLVLCIGSIGSASLIDSFRMPSELQEGKTVWRLRPTISLPALKITKSLRADAVLDVSVFASTGAGVSLQRIRDKGGESYCTFSVSPLTVCFAGKVGSEPTIDLAWAATVGFFNNRIMFGIGYDLGSVVKRNRLFGLLSLGINLK
jgi:hypothetical protein